MVIKAILDDIAVTTLQDNVILLYFYCNAVSNTITLYYVIHLCIHYPTQICTYSPRNNPTFVIKDTNSKTMFMYLKMQNIIKQMALKWDITIIDSIQGEVNSVHDT